MSLNEVIIMADQTTVKYTIIQVKPSQIEQV
jgi:hypothetical protein